MHSRILLIICFSPPSTRSFRRQTFLAVLLTAVSSIPRIVLFYIVGAQEVFVEWLHEWMNACGLQFCRQDFELSWDLPQLQTLPPALLSFQTDWTWFPEDPLTYLDTSPLVPGNSSFHFWIHILGCRRTSSFQDCYGKLNAVGNFWNWHIHPHLVSRNKTRVKVEEAGRTEYCKQEILLTFLHQIPAQYPDFLIFSKVPCNQTWQKNPFWLILCKQKPGIPFKL